MIVNTREQIIKKADKIVRMTDSRNPDRIAPALGILVMERDLGNTKGLYTVIKRNRVIIIDEKLDSRMKKIVKLHEIAHDQFHRLEACNVRDINLFGQETGHMEEEANLFAAHVSLPDEEILDLIYDGYDVEQIAAIMESDINLVSLKVADMVRRGYNLKVPEHKKNVFK